MDQDGPDALNASPADDLQIELDEQQRHSRRRAWLSHWLQVRPMMPPSNTASVTSLMKTLAPSSDSDGHKKLLESQVPQQG